MSPALRKGDRALVSVIYYDSAEPKRGDLVLIEENRNGKTTLDIKRIIAVGGDLVEITPKQVVVNGKALQEPYLDRSQDETVPVIAKRKFGPEQIANNSYFVLGDHREKSYDSLYFGPVDRSKIKGRAMTVIRDGGHWYQQEPLK